MPVSALHHFTLRCTPAELAGLIDFYTRVIGLRVDDRPELPLPGAWLYAQDEPIVHLYANVGPQDGPPAATTGSLDHISFRSRDIAATKEHLRLLGVPFTEAPVPGRPLHQIFVSDPTGLKIELTFWLEEEVVRGTNAGLLP